MPAHEQLGGALLECLQDVSSLLELAHSTAARQKLALADSDAETISATSASQEEVLRRIVQADERAAALAARIADQAGLDIETANPRDIAQAAGAPYAALIEHELGRMPELAERVRDANEVNSKLIANGLDVIASCLRIVAREPEPTVYCRSAGLAGSHNWALSLDSRV
jgi:hypothetical protein